MENIQGQEPSTGRRIPEIKSLPDMKRSLFILAASILLIAQGGAQDAAGGNVGGDDPHKRVVPKTLDGRLLANLRRMMEEEKVSEFISLMQYLSRKGIDKSEAAPLFFSSVSSPDDIYLLLLLKENLVDVNAVDSKGFSAFGHLFFIPDDREGDRRERLELLIELGYKVPIPEFLVVSSANNSVGILNFVEKMGRDDVSPNVRFRGTTPLIAAIKSGSLEAVNALLIRGADPDFEDESGKSAKDYLGEEWPKNNIPHLSLESIRKRQDLIREAVRKKGDTP